MKQEDNELLCRVEGDAPMGQFMRNHWLPACMSEEVAEPNCKPVRAELLGEKMVVWRDSNGRLGVLDEFCPHRRASLVYGRNEDCGLRCLYHGWKFDVDGNTMDMPSEPQDAKMRERTKTKSYQTQESGGFVWVWMGDAENIREFEPPLWAPTPNVKASIVKIHAACNWAQVLEGSIDSAHSSSLHSSDMPAADDVSGSVATDTAWLRPSVDKAPKLEFQRTDFGFEYAAIRKPILNEETHKYVRTTLFIAPFTVSIPPNDKYRLTQMLVPIDDVNTMFYWIAWHEDETKGIDQDAWRAFCGAEVGKDIDESYRKLRNFDNDYLQDREAMKAGNFTGIKGIPFQDMAMWESMGPIADRHNDRLGSSDLAIVQFRRVMLDAIKQMQSGGDILGADTKLRYIDLASYEGVVPKTFDWKSINVPDIDKQKTA